MDWSRLAEPYRTLDIIDAILAGVGGLASVTFQILARMNRRPGVPFGVSKLHRKDFTELGWFYVNASFLALGIAMVLGLLHDWIAGATHIR